MKNIQKNNIWIVENSYTDKMKILRKYWKIKKYLENVRRNKKYKNVRNCSKTNKFGFDVHKNSW